MKPSSFKSSIVCYVLVLLPWPSLSGLSFNPSAMPPIVSGAEEIPGNDTLKLRGLPLGRSAKLGALGGGLFRALPPITGISYNVTRTT